MHFPFTESFYVDPKTMKYMCWISLLVMLTMINILLLPARLAFMEDMWEFWSSFVIFDYLSDLCYVIDIVLRCKYLVLYERQGPNFCREDIFMH